MDNALLELFASSLETRPQQRRWLAGRRFYIGDLHNHCAISYGHGSLDRAIDFAKQQLDFFSVTGHFAWPDMRMKGRKVPQKVAEYHEQGFAKLRDGWADYLVKMAKAETVLVPFISYEYHSFLLGDYTIVCKDLGLALPAEPEGDDLRLIELLESNDAAVSGVLCIPHHIGYKTGYRGINWDAYRQQASPLVEIISMHGCAESDEAPFPYLHTMGPRHHGNTMQGGLSRGYRFGVIGSTDHHNASPGSFGSGRCGLWATDRNRDTIWDALIGKSTLALSGDPIEIAYFVDDVPAGGAVVPTSDTVVLDAYILGRSRLDRVEVVGDGRVLGRYRLAPMSQLSDVSGDDSRRFLDFACGWGQRGVECTWDVSIRVLGGELVSAVPRLRGEYVVDPLSVPRDEDSHRARFSFIDEVASLHCVTSGNVTSTTDETQGVSLEFIGGCDFSVEVSVTAEFGGNVVSRVFSYGAEELLGAPVSEYLDGFVSPSIRLSPVMPVQACSLEIHAEIPCENLSYLYLRAFEVTGDAAWTSPVWLEH